jgi:N-acetylglutamate synthase-like GNAT family acetyltransferase
MIRPALPDEAPLLTDLALRSKAYWDYNPDFLEACRADLTITAEIISDNTINVLQDNDQVVGFYGLFAREEDAVELEYLFIDPDAIGTGYGRQLWRHAVATAREQGFETMFINSDPHTEAFYEAMGAKRIGQSESAIWPGRMLPLMAFELI